MKKQLTLLCLLIISQLSFAQNGLEGIIVEKYYLSEANDTLANSVGGVLPVGSVTYRIYVDMLPGYKFQAAYGVDAMPLGTLSPGDHELRIETTTLFFNNEDRGAVFPTYTKFQSRLNTVILDSWLSVGAACAGNYGIMKSEDDGVATVVNNFVPPLIQNANANYGIPVSVEDGFITGTPESVITIGIDTIQTMFNNQNDGTNGPVFSTFNGSWASLNGSMGPDSLINKVIIAQITTDGIFSFKLNIQISTPTGGVENYVAENPVGIEIQIPSLIYDSSVITNSDDFFHSNSIYKIYPNPIYDHCVLEVNGLKNSNSVNRYTIYNIDGTQIFQKDLNDSNESIKERIDFDSYAKGVYLIKIEMDGVVSTKKLIKF
jgi:hypothetical protein